MVLDCGALGGGIDDDYIGEGTGMNVSDFEVIVGVGFGVPILGEIIIVLCELIEMRIIRTVVRFIGLIVKLDGIRCGFL